MTRAQSSLLVMLGVLIALFWLAPDVPLLGFSAVLLAIALRLPAEWVAGQIGMRRWIAVIVLALSALVLIGLGGWLATGPLMEQADQLSRDLPQSLAALRQRLAGTSVGDWLAARLEFRSMPEGGASMVASAAGGIMGGLGNAVLVLLMGIYLAIHPPLYICGLLALVHPSLKPQAEATLAECGECLHGWLLGQLFAMVVSGTLTWFGLMLLGVPLAGVLAMVVAILGFIPYIGPLIGAVPAVLLALTQSPMLALWVVLLFIAVQNIEGNILTPLVQSRTANLPPVLLLLAQILAGALFGLLGVALAAPMAAVGLVVTRRAYVEGWLGNHQIGANEAKMD